MPPTLLPSPVKQFIAWASVQVDLAAIHGGRVGTRVGETLPAVRVQRVGGVPDHEPVIDEPALSVECWGDSEGPAEDLVRTLVAVLPTFRGEFAGGKVAGATVTGGPYFSPDDPEISTSVRYVLTVTLTTTP